MAMDLPDAQNINRASAKHLLEIVNALVAIELRLHSIRDASGGIIQAGIQTDSMRQVVGMANDSLDISRKLRANMAAMNRTLRATYGG